MIADYELKNIDSEDLEELLKKVEASFDIKFGAAELANISTFGQLCNHISNKIHLVDSDGCTSQQAFYKLRDSISSSFHIDKRSISIDTSLATILPRQGRRLLTKQLENHLGFRLNILRPQHWIIITFVIFFLASLLALSFNWQIGLLGVVLSISGLRLAFKMGNELDLKTVGQVAEKMTRENYLRSRRNPKSFNKNEIENVMTDLFRSNLYIDMNDLTKDPKYV